MKRVIAGGRTKRRSEGHVNVQQRNPQQASPGAAWKPPFLEATQGSEEARLTVSSCGTRLLSSRSCSSRSLSSPAAQEKQGNQGVSTGTIGWALAAAVVLPLLLQRLAQLAGCAWRETTCRCAQRGSLHCYFHQVPCSTNSGNHTTNLQPTCLAPAATYALSYSRSKPSLRPAIN